MAALLLLFCFVPGNPVWTKEPAPLPIVAVPEPLPAVENLPPRFPSTGGQLAHYSTQDTEQIPYVENPLSSLTLPYAEGLNTTLPDKTRQADTALLQAVARLKQSVGFKDLHISIVLAETRVRRKPAAEGPLEENLEVYPFLQILLYRQNIPDSAQLPEESTENTATASVPAPPQSLSPDTVPLIRAVLEEALDIWAPETTLIQDNSPQGPIFFLRTDGTVTHCVVLAEPNFPSVPQHTPALALIIDDAGEDMALLRQILALPYPLAVSVLPESTHAEKTALLTKASGQEVFLHQPMEARPGYKPNLRNTLRMNMQANTMQALLWQSLLAVPGASGINNHTGSAFTADATSVQNFLDALAPVAQVLQKNFILIDSWTGPQSVFASMAAERGFPTYRRSFFMDEEADVSAILTQLAKSEKMVNNGESVLLIGHLRPATVKALKQWIPRVPVVFVSALSPVTLSD